MVKLEFQVILLAIVQAPQKVKSQEPEVSLVHLLGLYADLFDFLSLERQGCHLPGL